MGTHISYENAKNQRCDVLLRSEIIFASNVRPRDVQYRWQPDAHE